MNNQEHIIEESKEIVSKIKNKLVEAPPTHPQVKYEYDLDAWPEQYNYKIALIPMNLNFYRDFIEVNETKLGIELSMVKLLENRSEEIKDKIIRYSEYAIKHIGAKLVIFNEYSYPILKNEELCNSLSAICRENDACIIAGSFHITDENIGLPYGHNACPIFLPSGQFHQFKRSSGKFKDKWERIIGPSLWELYIFYSRFGTFSIPICIDIRDRNLVDLLSMLNRKGSLYHPIDFLIVPSFSSNDKIMHQSIISVSLVSNLCIIYLNNFANADSPAVFLSGKRQSGVYSDDPDNPRIYLYNIDLIKIRRERLLAEKTDIFSA